MVINDHYTFDEKHSLLVISHRYAHVWRIPSAIRGASLQSRDTEDGDGCMFRIDHLHLAAHHISEEREAVRTVRMTKDR